MDSSTARLAPESVQLRRAQASDVAECGRICYEAFATLNRHHNFPPDFPNVEMANQILSWMFSHEKFYCVVAEMNGKIVGSNCLDERCEIVGLGPITVDLRCKTPALGGD